MLDDNDMDVVDEINNGVVVDTFRVVLSNGSVDVKLEGKVVVFSRNEPFDVVVLDDAVELWVEVVDELNSEVVVDTDEPVVEEDE